MSSAHHPRTVERLDEDWYTHPAWYDILHTAGTAEEVDGLARIAEFYTNTRRRPHEQPLWLEPGCGTARYLRTAAARGIGVTGFDNCQPMLEYARAAFERRGLGGSIFDATFEDFSLPRKADFAFCLINTLRHLHTDKAVLAHLACMSRALRAGGAYAVGLSIVHPGAAMDSEDTWHGRRGSCDVTQLINYMAADGKTRAERVLSHLTVRTPTREVHLDSAYILRTYSLKQWLSLIGRSSMRLVAVVDEFGDEIADPDARNLRSEYAIWVLAHR